MKAALWYGKNDVRVEDIAEPMVKAGSVKIKVKWCGICGSDLHEISSRNKMMFEN
ncbi:threonine dehydrogenase-like Zn-dependent dehydrogenase [Sedimentibacter acidaminivorans]|uniref:Threonine dehydrogenase-like Zn-dependent dehydrogenase n=1 Tax=Sedimentibacter acidaminivorans TaxID=913099 RepID=A0ABS4GEW2_9FIRM|nr:alcohol dehydrogenase catalytic domain-containing protein [Sedimentibacter acidaminivorans]MBP1926224.1 threonine dehydrogenase-like Zn-dependent dehydrogenase [Sedimentibacter acidaminivorans]